MKTPQEILFEEGVAATVPRFERVGTYEEYLKEFANDESMQFIFKAMERYAEQYERPWIPVNSGQRPPEHTLVQIGIEFTNGMIKEPRVGFYDGKDGWVVLRSGGKLNGGATHFRYLPA